MATYARESGVPFIRPPAPTKYIAPEDNDLLVHHIAEKAHAKTVAAFQEVNLVEQTVLKS